MRYRYDDDRFGRGHQDAWQDRQDHERDRDRETRSRGREDERGWGTQGRHFSSDEDMGGSGWSGYSGRGGMSYRSDEDMGSFGGYGRGYGYGGGTYGGHGYGGGYGGQREQGGYGGYRGGMHEQERGWGRDRDRWDRDFGGRYVGSRDFASREFDRDMDRDRSMFWGREPYGQSYGREDRERMTSSSPARGEGYGRSYAMRDFEEDRGPFYGKGPKGYKRSDERIREEVCDLIANQGHIDASDVEVKVENCVVTLSGNVSQRSDKRALEQLVERARGVDEVHNELRLRREERTTTATGERDPTPSRHNGNRQARA